MYQEHGFCCLVVQQLFQFPAGTFVIREVYGRTTEGLGSVHIFLTVIDKYTLGRIQIVGIAEQFINRRVRLDQMYPTREDTAVKKRKEGQIVLTTVKDMLGPVGQIQHLVSSVFQALDPFSRIGPSGQRFPGAVEGFQNFLLIVRRGSDKACF